MTYLFLFIGLALLLAGANYLVDSSVAIAKKAKISDFVIGLTIVGMGTSSPELFVSVSSALRGLGDVSIGNVVGSNICNAMLILGVTALISPFAVQRSNLRRDIPLTVIVSLLLAVLSFDVLISGGEVNRVGRWDGIILLAGFVAFMAYAFLKSKPDEEENENKPSFLDRLGYIPLIGMAILSLCVLIFGGDMFLNNAVKAAKEIGLSDSVISVTIIAVGTSLPELITCIIAAMKGNSQLALGNVLGSNIFNILFILGTASVISPLAMSGIGYVDFSIMIISAILSFVFAFTLRRNVIDRWEGALLVAGYIGYTAYLLMQ